MTWSIHGLAWFYLASMTGVWLVSQTLADRWWPATLFIFGPRWVVAVPLLLLIPAAVTRSLRTLAVVATAAFVAIVPVMGLRVSLAALFGAGGGATFRVMTFNVQGSHVDLAALHSFVDRSGPDLMVFQEWPDDMQAPFGADPQHNRSQRGFHVTSRFPIVDTSDLVSPDEPWRVLGLHCVVATPERALDVFDVHLPTPRDGLEAILHGRLRGIPALRANIASRSRISGTLERWVDGFGSPALVMGDFNMPVESTIYGRDWGRYDDAFTRAGLGFGLTKFCRSFGSRIDHILATPGLRFTACFTGPDLGSDHRPVVADVAWEDTQG